MSRVKFYGILILYFWGILVSSYDLRTQLEAVNMSSLMVYFQVRVMSQVSPSSGNVIHALVRDKEVEKLRGDHRYKDTTMLDNTLIMIIGRGVRLYFSDKCPFHFWMDLDGPLRMSSPHHVHPVVIMSS